jgi:hypothetical protein
MKVGILRYPAIAALVLGGAVMVSPHTTHAQYYSISACAAGTTPTVISGLQLQVKGATNFALPQSASPANPYLYDAWWLLGWYMNGLPGGISPTAPTTSPVVTTTNGTSAVTTTTPLTYSNVQDYGYIWSVAGLGTPFQSGSGFTPDVALFQYFSNATTTDTTLMSEPPTDASSGTLTIYSATGQASNWSNPQSFQSGTPILTASISQNNTGTVVSNAPASTQPTNQTTSKGQSGVGQDFAGSGTATITSTTPFSLDGTCYQLGTVGTSFLTRTAGHLASPTSVNGAYTGTFASAGLLP